MLVVLFVAEVAVLDCSLLLQRQVTVESVCVVTLDPSLVLGGVVSPVNTLTCSVVAVPNDQQSAALLGL